MLQVLVSWIYYFILHGIIGWGFWKIVSSITRKSMKITIESSMVAAIILFTVYAQIFSLFGKVGAAAHLIIMVPALILCIIYRHEFSIVAKKILKTIFSWEGLVYLIIIVVGAFYTSRGTFHLDTQIYHAQAIQWLEEYGIVAGLGNLQQHFAYNSSYFAYAALFSMKFLIGTSLHTTTGFITVFMAIYALHYMKGFWNHKRHLADMSCMAILIYCVVILCGIMSPASDYITNLFALFVITKWCQLIEEGEKEAERYGYLAVVCVFLASLKISGGCLVILAVYPAVLLIKNRQWKQIIAFICMGLVVIVPFLIRNVILSGWLIYPFEGIDLFSVDWKIPIEYVRIDAAQIKVWARGLYDISLIDLSVWEWIGSWWKEQERYHQMIIYANVLGALLWIFELLHDAIIKKKIEWNVVVMVLSIFACLCVWFLLAPFVRYGLSFLLVCPFIAIGYWMHRGERGFYQISTSFCVIGIIAGFLLYIDHYITDDGVFLKQNMTEGYYITQKEYDVPKVEVYHLDDVLVYYPAAGEEIAYSPLPATAYETMVMRARLRGDRIEEGFCPVNDENS